jgi:hypothetical protein
MRIVSLMVCILAHRRLVWSTASLGRLSDSCTLDLLHRVRQPPMYRVHVESATNPLSAWTRNGERGYLSGELLGVYSCNSHTLRLHVTQEHA